MAPVKPLKLYSLKLNKLGAEIMCHPLWPIFQVEFKNKHGYIFHQGRFYFIKNTLPFKFSPRKSIRYIYVSKKKKLP